jgi:hypothetical protein
MGTDKFSGLVGKYFHTPSRHLFPGRFAFNGVNRFPGDQLNNTDRADLDIS